MESFEKELKKEIIIPEDVWKKYTNTLEHIDQLSEERKTTETMYHSGQQNKKTYKKWGKIAAVFAFILIGSSIIYFSNSVTASKFPLIGTIFYQIQNFVDFPGSYSGFHYIEELEHTDENNPNKTMSSIAGYHSTTSNGITITASEIYADGYSVYLTVTIKSDKPEFQNIITWKTKDDTVTASIYAGLHSGNYCQIGNEKQREMINVDFEGNVIDKHTFIGMIKLDRESYSTKDGKLTLNLSYLCYDHKDHTSEIKLKGNWQLTVPYTVDREHSRKIPVNQINKDGFGIESIVVTPFQVAVFGIRPDDSGTLYKAFIQDGTELDFRNTQTSSALFSVEDKKIETLHIYMYYWEDGMDLMDYHHLEDEKTVKKMSKFNIEIPVQ